MIKDDRPREYYEALTRENEAKVLKAEGEGSPVVPALPLRFTFELTADCNLHCPMCQFNLERTRAKARGHQLFTLPFERFEEIARHAFPTTREINPTVVGEPLLIPYLQELIQYLNHYATYMEIITNGMLLEGELMRQLLPVLSKVTISFDGATAKTFSRIRAGSDFSRIVRNVRNFVRLRNELDLPYSPEILFGITLMQENIEELPDIISLAAELGVDYVSAANLIVFQESQRSSSLFYHLERANACLEKARERAEEAGMPVGLPKPLPLDFKSPPRKRGKKGLFVHRIHEAAGLLCEEKGREQDFAQRDWKEPGQQLPQVHGGAAEKGTAAPVFPRAGSPRRHPEKRRAPLIPPPVHPRGQKWSCRFLWREAFVGFNGDVTPCCIQGRPSVGNAFKEDFMKIWNGRVYQSMRSRLASGNPFPCCRKCTVNAEMGNIEYDPSSFLVLDKEEEE